MAGFGQAYGLSSDLGMRLGRALGSGMGLGQTCGAPAAAFLLLALQAGPAQEEERPNRSATYARIKEFTTRFQARHQTLSCRDLLGGLDITTPEGFKAAKEQGLFKTVCPAFVQSAGEILGEIK